ncbi:MAG: zinc-binding dehydrogenase [Deltaproteobacteria bacterium]|nr:zinc-binding dehydrogenase [Deltaproteobacteria bacterium]
MEATANEIVIAKYGPAERLTLRARAADEPGPHEVTIDVRYSGINFADIQMRLGLYPEAPPKPFVPGYEVSGIVAAVGEGVTRFKIGDEVVAGTLFGGYTSKITLAEDNLFPLPRHIDLAQGAALPVAFFTAHLALVDMGRVRKGDRVLIECATGGVGTIAVQIAKHLGAEVVGLTTSPRKKAYIESLGARAYTSEEFLADKTLKDFDFVLNSSGGRSVKQQMARLGLTGRIVCIGMSSGIANGKRSLWRMAKTLLTMPIFPVLALFNRNQGVFALNALRVLQDPKWVKKLTEALVLVEEMRLAPHVDRVFSSAEAPAAHEYIQTKQAKGKVLLSWN